MNKRTFIKGAVLGAGGLIADTFAASPAAPAEVKSTVETALEPELVICDPHHHLWDRPGDRYLLEDLRRDAGGHKVVQTVFVECYSGYRTEGPAELRPLGETE